MPVVDGSDSIQQPNTTGMTPEQATAAMTEFQERVMENARRLVAEARQQSQVTPPSTPPTTPLPGNDTVTRAEFNALTEAGKQGLVYTAQQMAKEGKSDWDRHFPKVKAIVESLPLDQQINKDVWQEAYYNVRGHATDTLIDEARRSALGLEPPSPPPVAPPKPREYNADEANIIDRLGITKDMYADAEKKLATGFQPFTTDNRRGRSAA